MYLHDFSDNVWSRSIPYLSPVWRCFFAQNKNYQKNSIKALFHFISFDFIISLFFLYIHCHTHIHRLSLSLSLFRSIHICSYVCLCARTFYTYFVKVSVSVLHTSSWVKRRDFFVYEDRFMGSFDRLRSDVLYIDVFSSSSRNHCETIFFDFSFCLRDWCVLSIGGKVPADIHRCSLFVFSFSFSPFIQPTICLTCPATWFKLVVNATDVFFFTTSFLSSFSLYR